ncbi:MAG: type II secretion system protein GspG [Kiritimatiellae bacterium]|nr:type II secretion system protein GspG [Kiritimatiellia bacterium]
MSVTMSKPPKPFKVTRDPKVAHGVRWRSSEERKIAKRKIEAIRRATEQAHLEHASLNISVLHSPKMMLGILVMMVFLGTLVISAFRTTPEVKVSTLPLQQNRARRSLQTAALALTLYRVHTGGWPSQRLGLYALAKNYGTSGWRGPYINWAYKDPWGTPYVYTMPKSPFEVPELYSCGPDTLPQTNDDIRVTEADFTCEEGTWKRPEPVTETTSEDLSND